MSEDRKPKPPPNPRPSRLPRLSFVRPLVPAKSQNPLSSKSTTTKLEKETRPIRPYLMSTSLLPKVTDPPRKTLIPVPPKTVKSAAKKRPVSVNYVPPKTGVRGRNLSIVGKPVQKKGKEQINRQTRQSSQETVHNIKTSEEAKILSKGRVDLKKGPLFNRDIPLALEFFKREGFKIPPSRSFEALSNGSHIPILIRSSKQRVTKQPTKVTPQKKSNTENEIKVHVAISPVELNQVSKDEKALQVKVLDEQSDETREKSVESTPNVTPQPYEKPAVHAVTMIPKESKPFIRQRVEPARLLLEIKATDKQLNTHEELQIIDEHTGSSLKEHQNMKLLREMVPSRSKPQKEITELEEKRNPDTNMVMNEMIKELEKLKEHLSKVKSERCAKVKVTDEVEKPLVDQRISKTNPVTYVKTLANEVTKLVNDVDIEMKSVQQSAREIVELMVGRLTKAKDTFDETLVDHEKEILRLQGINSELEYSKVEKDCKIKSLERVMDRINRENEKLEIQNSKLLEENKGLKAKSEKENQDLMFRARVFGSDDLFEENKRLAAQVEKSKQDAIFRARELTNLHLDIQRRDNRSSELLDEYHVLWKDRSCLSLRVASLEAELKQGEHARISLHEHNSNLGREIATLEDKISELENRNTYVTSVESNVTESTYKQTEIIPDMDNEVPTHKESQPPNSVTKMGISEHVLFVESGKVINGLTDIPKKIPTTAFQAISKYNNAPCQIVTRGGKKIERYWTTEHKNNKGEMDKAVAVLKKMSDKIKGLGMKNMEKEKWETHMDETANDQQKMPDNDLLVQWDESMAQEKCEDHVDKVVAIKQEIPDLQFEKCSASMIQEKCEDQRIIDTHQEGTPDPQIGITINGMGQEKYEDQIYQDDILQQEVPNTDVQDGIVKDSVDQEKCEEHVERVASFQQEILDKDFQFGKRKDALVQENCDKKVDQDAAVSGEMLDKLLHLGLAIQERNIQIEDLQNTVDFLTEKNDKLENEKIDMISERQGFLLENMEEVKKLKKMEESLREKERLLKEKFENDEKETKEKNVTTDKETDWYEECMKSCQRVREMEECMMRQDKMVKELETDRKKLMQDNKNLRIEIATMTVEDVSFAGLPKTLQGLEDIVKELRRSKVFCNGVRKKIRCFTKSDVAIEELQHMNKNTLVISVGDVTINDEEKKVHVPPSPDDMLIKKPKLIKRHRMKNKQSRLFMNKENKPNVFLSPMPEVAVFSGCIRRRHKRKNPSVLLRFNQSLSRINEERAREERITKSFKETINETFDESLKETFEDIDGSAMKRLEGTIQEPFVDKEEVTAERTAMETDKRAVENKVDKTNEETANAVEVADKTTVDELEKEVFSGTIKETLEESVENTNKEAFKEIFQETVQILPRPIRSKPVTEIAEISGTVKETFKGNIENTNTETIQESVQEIFQEKIEELPRPIYSKSVAEIAEKEVEGTTNEEIVVKRTKSRRNKC